MNIFFFSTVFYPRTGGIERTAEILCTQFAALGHEVRLATLTPADDDDSRFRFPVVRRPTFLVFRNLLRWCDVHLQANVSLKYMWPHLLSQKPIIYRHGNVYQRDDGSLAWPDRLKCAIAKRTQGIANSKFTAEKLGCRHTVLNPYDDAIFVTTEAWEVREWDLVFLGRLVSQKGCDTLLKALARLAPLDLRPTLTVIGDGPDRAELEGLARTLGVERQVRFVGRLVGSGLAHELNRHRIFVAPSRYEEPFGVVALEALACGCFPIVSERGGLVEAIGPHGLSFPNGDEEALANLLADTLSAPARMLERLEGVQEHLRTFRAPVVAAKYLQIIAQASNAGRKEGHRNATAC